MKGLADRGSKLSFGEYGLKAVERAWMSSRQVEAGRRAITHSLKRGGKVWVRVFPDKPVTARPAGQRMGSGKGDIDRYVAVVTPGRIIYEVSGAASDLIRKALHTAGVKMPFKVKIVSREV